MTASPTVAILATLDTKEAEACFLKERIEALGGKVLLVDIGVVGAPQVKADLDRAAVAAAGGTALEELLEDPTRQAASPVMIAGATKLLLEHVGKGEVHAVLALGGTQGTSNCCAVMQALPYGLPKVMVSTVASGDTAPFVGIKDITMMFSVGDLLGLNPFTRRLLSNAAGAAYGMALGSRGDWFERGGKPLIGMTNLGVLTEGAMHAIEKFHEAGYEVLVFHAVGSGGAAMEQMMEEGIIGAVFDYALGEISDALFDGLRAGNQTRLTVAGRLGLPQVLCPGGSEHIGLLVEANTIPDAYEGHLHVFHNPIVFAPRLSVEQWSLVAEEIGKRLQHTKGDAVMMLPLRGTSRYSIQGGPLCAPEEDARFFEALRAALPASVEVVERELAAEDDAFVDEAVARLVGMLEG
ncbi:MAG: Tm-1-like ATP-binding domain-containing protein [Planctomycetota bacterium]|jgi:uncharacterized protein (UPF0261 family)